MSSASSTDENTSSAPAVRTLHETDGPETLYLDLLKRCLTRLCFEPMSDENDSSSSRGPSVTALSVRKALGPAYVAIVRRLPFKTIFAKVADRLRQVVERNLPVDVAGRYEGRDWPLTAETMIGMKRLDNLQQCVVTALKEGVPGDFIETGVWRGGATILMRGVLKAYGVHDRRVFVADSFKGLPPPDSAHPDADAGDIHWTFGNLAVSRAEVQNNFQRYGLLDGQVHFLEGWFSDTLRTAPIERLAVLRLDGDMYGSTMDALQALYGKVSPGGFVIVDDYAIPGCRQAIHDFRRDNEVTEPIEEIDWTGVFWRKSAQ